MISIIIPVYNRTKLLKHALRSIANQTYKGFEVIVVDDGSEPPIDVKCQMSNVKCFRIGHGGANKARNYGFSKSKGEYVIFWDHDVIGSPIMLAKMHTALREHPEASYAYSSHYYSLKKFTLWPFDAERLRQMPYIHTTSLIRRERFPKSGWDESIKKLQDWDLWLTMLEHGHRGQFISIPLFKILGGGTMSGWLPNDAFKAPWKWLLPPAWRKQAKAYLEAVKVIKRKHGL